jgi:hypothetical protein
MKNEQSNVQIDTHEFTKEDIARAIRQIAYRKAYNKSPRQVTARKQRQQRIKIAIRYVKEHPEVLR